MSNTVLNSVDISAVDISAKYQKKTDKQHILDNPNMYIGSIDKIDANMWVCDKEWGVETATQMVLKNIEYIPALYKLFDEIIVNSRDHVIRMIQSPLPDKQNVTNIKVEIDKTNYSISVLNDGDGIDIVRHTEYEVYIPELIFANLRTSTNYNKDEKKIVGGVNGLGVKLVFIWSKYARIETVDHRRKLKYVQEFRDNLNTILPPKITAYSGKSYTKITFIPDYMRLGISNEISDDMLLLFQKRVFDIAGITDHSVKKVKVYFNNVIIPIKNFKNYVELYIKGGTGGTGGTRECESESESTNETSPKKVYEENGERWEYAVAVSPTGTFEAVSFVNGISTSKGGKHVEYIMGQITKKLSALIEKKKKITVSANTIKEQLIVFVRCDIENPSFDSQSKECMNSPYNKFGSSCTISDGFIERLSKIGIMDAICALTELKENKLAKKTDGSKTKNIRGISNFIDANFAGSSKSKDCILILCEGLSAMTGVVSGLSSSDRDIYGIYPLRGKLLNVRGENIKKISENKEITDLKKILGLETGKQYNSSADIHSYLRYGKIMYLVDSDVDGSHIKGLCVNMIHSEWASLFRNSGFLCFMNTPILKAFKRGQPTQVFYNEGEYNIWKEQIGRASSSEWSIKYFKGLGTSTATEFKEYFANKKTVNFVYNDTVSDDTIDKIFNKKRADERKTWLENYDKNAYLNTSNPSVNYEDFVNNELIHFSVYDCQRSIPNLMDGLKTSQRKILYCALKRNLTSEIKVAQFSGYVSEKSSYHHGEMSLNKAIVAMAQNFVGSNNINLLEPKGQFGSILQGGDDSASERYIFTNLTPITRFIFKETDDDILKYLEDDGTAIEPEFYIPILPFVLINGQTGIGTGFSTSIPSYNPLQIVNYLKEKMLGLEFTQTEFIPYYEGFKGTVQKIDDNKFLIKGVYSKITEDQIRITELPIGTWTMPYITFLEGLMDGGVDKKGCKIPPIIKDFVSNSTEKSVDIRITFPKGKLTEYISDANSLEKLLKLTTTVSTTNMHLFDKECKLRKYHSIYEIIDAYYEVRIDTYVQRKEYLMGELNKILRRVSNKAKYIQLVLDDLIDLRRKSNTEIDILLLGFNLEKLCENEISPSFDYLLKLPMNSVSVENVEKLMKEKIEIEIKLCKLEQTSITEMWKTELEEFEKQYTKYIQLRFNLPVIKKNNTIHTNNNIQPVNRPLGNDNAQKVNKVKIVKK
jgi:DNA topoisomerase-2